MSIAVILLTSFQALCSTFTLFSYTKIQAVYMVYGQFVIDM